MSRYLTICLITLFFSQYANADLYSANQALSRGDYQTAVKEFERLAEQGNAKAQSNLGYMYYVVAEVQPEPTITEEEPKKGFFGKLFDSGAKKQQEQVAAENEEIESQEQVAATEVDDSDLITLDNSAKDLVVAQAEPLDDEEILSASEIGKIKDYDEAISTGEETVRRGKPIVDFFGGLFGKKDKQATDTNSPALPDSSTELTDEGFKALEEELQIALVSFDDKNYDEAFLAYRNLATQGDAIAQYHLGSMYYQGLGIQRDYEEAANWYRRAASQGYVDAQYSLGNMYLMGEGMSQDDSLARHWYSLAADQGHDFAKHNLKSLDHIAEEESTEVGEIVAGERSNSNQDDGGSESYVEKKSRFGFFKNIFKKDESSDDIESQEEANSGVEEQAQASAEVKNQKKKKNIFGRIFGKKDDKSETAQSSITSTISEEEAAARLSDVIEIDTSEEEVDETPSAVSDYKTGLAFLFGEGRPKDSSEAFSWFLKSAEQGYAPAQHKLGTAYAYAEGVKKDPEEAVKWYRMAADQGHAFAQRNLGIMYMNGNGIVQNKALALAWYSILAENGNVMDMRRRDMLKSELSETETKKSKQLKTELERNLAPAQN